MLQRIKNLLNTLGITCKYYAYRPLIIAIELAIENDERLEAVVKEIYIKISEQFNCNWRSIERNMRTAINHAWITNPDMLIHMSGRSLNQAPTNSDFLAIVSNYIQRNC